MPGNRAHICVVGEFLGLDLVAHRLDCSLIGANPDDAFFRQGVGKARPLRQEAVTGMHGFGAGLLAGFNDFFGDQVGLRCRCRANMNGLICQFDMKRIPIRVRVDRDGADPHTPRRFHDPASDLAPIGNKNFRKHVFPPNWIIFSFVGRTPNQRNLSKGREVVIRMAGIAAGKNHCRCHAHADDLQDLPHVRQARAR